MTTEIVLSPKEVIDLLDRLESSSLSEDDCKVLKKIVRESLSMRVIRIASTKVLPELSIATSLAQKL